MRVFLLISALALGCAECEEDFDCPNTQVCNSEREACEPFVCRRNEHCPPGRVCRANACRGAASAPPAPDALVIGVGGDESDSGGDSGGD